MATRRKNHLELRGSVWYVRWDVPKDVRHAFGNKRIIKKRLSIDKKEAEVASLALLHLWKKKVVEVRDGTYDSEFKLKDKLRNIKLDDHTLTLGFLGKVDADYEKLKSDFLSFKIDELDEEINSIYSEYASPELQEWGRFLTDDITKLSMFIYAKRGRHVSKSDVLKFLELKCSLDRKISIVQAHINTETNLSADDAFELIKDLELPAGEDYSHGVSDSLLNEWKLSMQDQYKRQKTVSDYFSKMKRFQGYLNDKNLGFDYMAVSDFKKSISNMRQTQSSYVGSIRRFWKWAILHSQSFSKLYSGSVDPTEYQQYPKYGEFVGESYSAFRKEDVVDLFDSCLDRSVPDVDLACLIAYGVLTGARLEELGSINISNTFFDKKEPVSFFVNDAKTSAGVREIPLHSDLIEIHKELLSRERAVVSIFQVGETKRGTRLDHMSKRFGRLKKSLGFSGKYVFHSLRKTFITELYEQDVAEPLIQRLVGHRGGNLTSNIYLEDFSLSRKINAVRSIVVDLDISKLLKVMRNQS